MADRVVSVRLQAIIGPYSAALAKASRDTKELKQSVGTMAKEGDSGFRTLSGGALIAGAGMAMAFGKMISVSSNFQKEMSGVQAVSGATSDEMKRLSEAAIAAGASTKLAGVTASDAAKAEAELVKAGVSVNDVLGGALMGSLTLAAAGQIDFAKSAEIAAQAMNIFDLKGSQVTHVADVLAAAANKSAADVGQLGDALRQGGLVASQTGLSLEETTGALAAFADNALLGSDAGTSLKTMLQRLTPQSAEAQELMDELGFSAYDAQGNFIGLEGLAGELTDSLGDMTVEQRNSAMATLFGSDAVRAANILYTEGAEGMAEYVAAVNDQGAAARMAAIQNDNLAGDVEALGGAFESAMIENGSKANDTLRFLTQSVTGLVTGFSDLPGIVQTGVVGFAGLATAGLLALGTLGMIAPKIQEARKALDQMGSSGEALNRHLGKIGGGLAVIGAGVAVLSTWQAVMGKAKQEAKEWSEVMHATAMSHAGEGLEAFKSKLDDVRWAQDELTDSAGNFWTVPPWDLDKHASLKQAAEDLGMTAGEMERIVRLSEDMADGFGISGDAALEFVMGQQAAGIDILADDYEAVSAAMGETFSGMTEGTIASQALGEGMETLGSEIASVEEQVKAFNDSLDALYNQLFGVESAADAFQSTMNALPEVLAEAKEEGLSLNDVLTSQSDAAIGVRSHMRDMTQAASDLIAEWHEQGITGSELQGRIDMLSGSFRHQAEAAGAPRPVVEHYLRLLSEIPSQRNTEINVRLQGFNNVIAGLDAIARRSGMNVLVNASVRAREYATPGYQRASGGYIDNSMAVKPIYRSLGGPIGTDTVPLWASPGEYMVRKSSVDAVGLPFMDALNRGDFSAMTSGRSGGSTVINYITNVDARGSIGERQIVRTVRDAVESSRRTGV